MDRALRVIFLRIVKFVEFVGYRGKRSPFKLLLTELAGKTYKCQRLHHNPMTTRHVNEIRREAREIGFKEGYEFFKESNDKEIEERLNELERLTNKLNG